MYAHVNGVQIYFDVEGRELSFESGSIKKKPVCFVLHGGPGGELTGFAEHLSPLSEVMQLIYIDQRGCGRSGKSDASLYTMDQNIDDLEALRKYLGLEKVVVFGHSYGGMVAQGYAIRYPESTAGLLLIATSPGNEFGKQALQEIERTGTESQIRLAHLLFAGEMAEKEDFVDFKLEMEPLYYYSKRGRTITTEEREAWLAKELTFNLEVSSEGNKFLHTFNYIPQLHEISCPVLVMGGRHDWITPVEASFCMAETIPDAELVVLEESCHYVYVDEPDRFVDELIGFIRNRLY